MRITAEQHPVMYAILEKECGRDQGFYALDNEREQILRDHDFSLEDMEKAVSELSEEDRNKFLSVSVLPAPKHKRILCEFDSIVSDFADEDFTPDFFEIGIRRTQMIISRRTFVAGIAVLIAGTIRKAIVPALTVTKESIRKQGLIRPIVVDKDIKLISGYRRLEVCKELGFTHIQCAIVHDNSRGLLLDLENSPISINEITIDELIGGSDDT